VPGCGLARPANFAMPHGPARHENQPIVLYMGRKLGPRTGMARPVGHGMPSRFGDHRAVARCQSLLGPEYDSVVSSVLARSDPISATELYALLLNYEQRHAPGAYSRWWLLKFVGQRCLPWAQWRTARPYPWRWWP
jgi:hypothetical protein